MSFVSFHQGIFVGLLSIEYKYLNVRRMDKRIVGVNAGNVWHVLNEVKRISIPELAKIGRAHV